MLEKHKVSIERVSTKDNLANPFTKYLAINVFCNYVQNMRLALVDVSVVLNKIGIPLLVGCALFYYRFDTCALFCYLRYSECALCCSWFDVCALLCCYQ